MRKWWLGLGTTLTVIAGKFTNYQPKLMAYSSVLASRIRNRLASAANVEGKEMMGGLTFMVNGKMCIGIIGNEMMCRIDPNLQEEALRKEGCRLMDFTGRPMKGYVMANAEAMRTDVEFEYWIGLCLAFNKKAKASKKRK
jgi:TfoX/Sxy family transcriptional regulator of competence genes